MKKTTFYFLVLIVSSLTAFSQNEFITVWKTDNPGSSSDDTIEILISNTYPSNFDIDWGDGNTQTGLTASVSHTYATAGTYTVKMTGTICGIRYAYLINSDREKLLEIQQWGNIPWRIFKDSFKGCTNLNITATDAPNLSQVTSLESAFTACSSITNPNLNGWDVSTITNMKSLFHGATNFNGNITNWNTSNVSNMSYMFYNTKAFNQNIGTWNVSSATDMSFMFYDADAFNQNIGTWNVGLVTNFSNMFSRTALFNQNLNSWNVSSGTNFSHMFSLTSVFNQPLNNWNMANATNISYMFSSANAFNSDVTGWNVANVTNMARVFNQVSSFNQNLSGWVVSSATNMDGMFLGTSFNQNISSWNVSNVTDMGAMFQNTPFNQDISGWNVSSVTDMGAMFFQNTAFNQNISNWNVSNVTTFWQMFYGATSFNQNLGSWNVISLTDATQMFFNAGLSTANYDALLIGWSSKALKSNVTFHAGSSIYCTSETERNSIINTYNWTIMDGGPCGALSIDNNELNSVVIYPNPVSDLLNIELPESIDRAEIKIYSVTGQLVFTSFPEIVNNTIRISLNKIDSGTYLIKIISEKEVLTKQLILK